MPRRSEGVFPQFSQLPRTAPMAGPLRAAGSRSHHSGSRLRLSTDFGTRVLHLLVLAAVTAAGVQAATHTHYRAPRLIPFNAPVA
ncbi:hypothetical protein SAM23877_7556 [Streptomyces ambofaciens ATCC 23877]|uniref:Uncharacterized protein n=1 Tax=Streptomyces ambofaciens (strain ATCC 23877 / 3486 / DSM 40053 / JCM 4204 / NBRC 12836 / NRRL B-2516) TaxID=278992 RepID=A0A0K2B6C9_STRA7|nr:hypothetical protein SAM23877_0117 [Streptomyces ambofaciens ATCC 23877]AKZ60597.1 hypothetical protein SAM23877_7556 [Streptomyces ambofaciens ATCC 23877]